MRGGFAKFLVGITTLLAGNGAIAMTTHSEASRSCRVSGAEKLPVGVGQDLVCSEIARAMAQHHPNSSYKIEVKILSSSRLSAVLTVDGQRHPTQNLAVSDRELSVGPIRRFASALADLAGKD